MHVPQATFLMVVNTNLHPVEKKNIPVVFAGQVIHLCVE